MEQNSDSLKDLQSLFRLREQAYSRITKEVLERIGPTVLSALYEFFEVPYESISWIDLQMVEDVLLIVAVVSYKGSDAIPELVKKLAPMADNMPPTEEITEIQRMMRIGIPADCIFKTKDEVLVYLRAQADKQPPVVPKTDIIVEQIQSDEPEVVVDATPGFDESELSPEQVQQILFFQQQTRGLKQ